MTHLRLASKPVLASAATAMVAGLVALTGALLDTDRLLTRGLDVAFAEAPRLTPRAASGNQDGLFDPAALRPSAWREGHQASADAVVQAGDRITITGTDGRNRVIEVVETRALESDVTRIEAGDHARLVLVTSRVVGEPGRVVRFLVEETERPVDTSVPPVAPAPRTL
ncbi:MAG: hypothetical protein ACOYLQ_08520 [Hyphomicrobiaceae bacterium]|jgi:hypothetical protein